MWAYTYITRVKLRAFKYGNGLKTKNFIKSLKAHAYEKSRHLMDFHIAGFAYYDGLDVIDEFTLGKPVELLSEADNLCDPEAVAIYYQTRKIGYDRKTRMHY